MAIGSDLFVFCSTTQGRAAILVNRHVSKRTTRNTCSAFCCRYCALFACTS